MLFDQIVRSHGIMALLSDMDGVIIDSLTADLQIVNEILAEKVGKTARVTPEEIRAHFGYPVPEFWRRLLALVGVTGSTALEERVQADYMQRSERIRFPVLPGVGPLFQHAKELGLQTAVVSNNGDRRVAELVAMADLTAVTDRIIGNTGVVNSKPAPDIYLLAARSLGLSASVCLTMEDTVIGVQSAQGAGIGFVIGVTTGGSTEAELRAAKPDLIISSLEELL